MQLVKSSAFAADRRIGAGARLGSAMIALTLLAPLVIAARLTPSPAGHGTHTALGLYPCTWAAVFGYPCPTCGMTTSWAHLAHGSFLESLRAQPMGALLCVMAATGFWFAVHAAATGSRVGAMVGGLLKGWVWWGLGGALVLAWVYKIVTWTG